MRRRVKELPGALPSTIRDYRATDWGNDEHAPCRWYAARIAWIHDHPDGDLPVSADHPDTPWKGSPNCPSAHGEDI